MNVVAIQPDYISPKELYHYLKAMATLEIMITPQKKEYLRVVKKYPFRKAYSIDNGAGDTLDILFEKIGVFIKGFDHENVFNQFGADKWNENFFNEIYANVPNCFLDTYKMDNKKEELYYMTFCMWYDNQQECWKQNIVKENDGGQDFLLGYVHTNAQEWIEWAKDYYDMDINDKVVEKVYQGEQMTTKDILLLNPKRNVEEALKEIIELE